MSVDFYRNRIGSTFNKMLFTGRVVKSRKLLTSKMYKNKIQYIINSYKFKNRLNDTFYKIILFLLL